VTAVQAVALVVVALAGGAVALAREPLRQALLLGIYGLALTLLFFALQAPDVALSELAVSSVGLPVIVFAALRKIAQRERADDSDGERE
jgi:energy-converting hydrogenase B subunit D